MTPPEPHRDALAEYRRKRSAGATPEPLGSDRGELGGVFVVQLHAATQRHFDLRIEVGGVLKSWAVPRGPSLDPQEKRYAIITEDHPLEYADFEGVIPKGNYGAGEMIVWDRGLCVPHIEHDEGLRDGKLLFELRGYKLRGLWTLVRTKNPKEWLWIKKPDAHATGEDAKELAAGSVFSGLTVEELRQGSDRAERIAARLEELGAAQRPVESSEVDPMLCQLRHEPFSGPGWWFEIKYDGYRLRGAKRPPEEGRGSRLRRARFHFRSGAETTAFPDLARALVALPYRSLVLDGEVTVLDDGGKPSFHRLQQRARLSRPLDVDRAAIHRPATWFVFDLLGFEDFDLRPLPLADRKNLLREVLPAAGPLRFVDHIAERGEEVFAGVRQLGLEGMVAKRAEAPYVGGRSDRWVKVRADATGDFAVIGYQLPERGRTGFRALHLVVWEPGEAEGDDPGRWRYVGKVGSGFSESELSELREYFEGQPGCEEPRAVGELPTTGEHVWFEPVGAAEVRYSEITPVSATLRHPTFLRWRDDKPASDCRLDVESALGRGDEPEPSTAVVEDPGQEAEPPREVPFTNRDKVFWPEDGFTKGDLIDYYQAIAPWLLPYLENRPLVLDRYPDGIHGKSFFQKNAPDFAPEWIRTERLWSEDSEEETLVFVCDNVETLLYLANLGTIPIHVAANRVHSLQNPDWCILDLDCKDAPFDAAIEIAQSLHQLCDAARMPSFAKTSGATGLHVLLPLGGQCTHEQSKQLALLLARVVVDRLPEIASIERLPAQREGKVYVDALQNGYGKLLVAPFSARPRVGGPVSMPLRWDEVVPGLDPAAFDLKTAPERLTTLGDDPLRPLLGPAPSLLEVLGRLVEAVE